MQVIFVGYSRTRDSCAMGDFVVLSGSLPQLLENGVAKVAKACVEEEESICPLHFSLRPKEVQDLQALHLRPLLKAHPHPSLCEDPHAAWPEARP